MEIKSSPSSIIDSKKRKRDEKTFEIVSLNSVITTLIVSLLQFYLIWHRFKQLDELTSTLSLQQAVNQLSVSFMLAHSITSSQIHVSILIVRAVLTVSLLFSIIYSFLNPFKLGIKSHDNFKIGKTVDKNAFNLTKSRIKNSSSSSFESSEDGSGLSGSALSLSFTSVRNGFICYKLGKWWRSPRIVRIWSELPPIGSGCHLISALLILVADLLLAAIQIQLGLVPAGNIFVTKLDFFYGRPIDRQFTLGEMFASKDDFTRYI